jgi:hypothetical protein
MVIYFSFISSSSNIDSIIHFTFLLVGIFIRDNEKRELKPSQTGGFST